MPTTFRHLLLVVALCGTVASIAYCVLSAWAAIIFLRRRPLSSQPDVHLPPASILKPLKGADPEMYKALRSHCVQNYPQYEILFGITDANDPAVEVIARLKQEFPESRIKIVRCEKRLGANGKISSLAQMVPQATHEILLVNDSDIWVGPDYLRTVVMELEQPGTGLVTCLYRGRPSATLGSKLEALGISTDFAPGVLVARLIEGGLHFGLGSTLAFRKRDLQAIGGFEALVDYLADDYELGKRITKWGLRVELSSYVVETHLPAYDFSGFVSHQLRWARTIRASRPAGYAGLLFTFTLPWAAAALLLGRGTAWAWWIFAAAAVARVTMALLSSRVVLRDSLREFWLLPLRDFFAPVIWLMGLAGRKIVWRGEAFSVENGKLRREG